MVKTYNNIKLLIAGMLFFLGSFFLAGITDTRLITTEYTFSSKSLPEEFDDFSIVVISDFHLKDFGRNESRLIQEIKNCSPDLIAFTGDNVDEQYSSLDNLDFLLSGICDLCPVVYVNGNHETDNPWLKHKADEVFSKYHAINLNEKSYSLARGSSEIFIQGMSYTTYAWKWDNNFAAPEDTFSVLLFHDANCFTGENYGICHMGYDLVLSGHLHGGLIRLPFIGGLIDSDFSLFPHYDKGIYSHNGSTMIVSSGLGDAVLPRFFNPPEIVKITLKSGNTK